jgi:hypothetical protein
MAHLPHHRHHTPEEELAEDEHIKEEQVLEREGFEEELMEEDRSELGEEFDDVQDEGPSAPVD